MSPREKLRGWLTGPVSRVWHPVDPAVSPKVEIELPEVDVEIVGDHGTRWLIRGSATVLVVARGEIVRLAGGPR